MNDSGVDTPPAGQPTVLAPGVTRILAPNPSPMTHWGTNTYVLGRDVVMIVDPGPADAAHLAEILATVAERPVSHVIVSHAHIDHSALAPAVARSTGAPVVAFGPANAGRSAVMTALAHTGLTDGGEGIDRAFAPDMAVADGEIVENADTCLRVLHTPGHLGNHICLAGPDHYFTGDHLMGWAPSLVSPPDGDLTDFMASCARLHAFARAGQTSFPGHGAPIAETVRRLDQLIAHRRGREAQILAALAANAGSAADIARRVYTDIPAALLPAATRNVLAHLVDLTTRNNVRPTGPITAKAVFSIL